MNVYLSLLAAHLPALLTGLAVVELLWPRRGPADGWLKLALAPGLGWGISSALFFFWSLAFSPYHPAWRTAEWALTAALGLAALWRGRRAWTALRIPRPERAASLLPGAAALLVFALSCGLLWLRGSAQPNGNFDAYAIWNLRARFLFLSDWRTWREAFSPALAWWVHADYPLLWPLTLLRGYSSQARLLTQAGVFQALVFGAQTAALFSAGLYRLRPGWQASAGGLFLIGLPWFIQYTAFQQADVPLASFYLATMILLLLNLRESRPGLAALAGLAAGCAAWTKNDGSIFLIAAALNAGFGAGGSARLRRLAAFGVGLLLPLTALLVFKVTLAPPGDLLGAQPLTALTAKLLDPARYAAIATAMLQALPGLGGLPWPAAAGGLAWLVLAGRSAGRSGARLLVLPGLTLLGYGAVYLITPHPLAWHLGYSLDRLLFHLLVPTLFLAFALVRSPEELIAGLRRTPETGQA